LAYEMRRTSVSGYRERIALPYRSPIVGPYTYAMPTPARQIAQHILLIVDEPAPDDLLKDDDARVLSRDRVGDTVERRDIADVEALVDVVGHHPERDRRGRRTERLGWRRDEQLDRRHEHGEGHDDPCERRTPAWKR